MNSRQRRLKRKFKTDQEIADTTPEIDCLTCDRLGSDAVGMNCQYFCQHPEADHLRGRVLHKTVGAVSLDFLGAPPDCPLRRK